MPLQQAKQMFRDALTADLERLAAGGGKARAQARDDRVAASPELSPSAVAIAPEETARHETPACRSR